MKAIPHPKNLNALTFSQIKPGPIEPSRVSFSTESGPVVIESYAPGIMRVQIGLSQLPDYGLLANPSTQHPMNGSQLDAGFRFDTAEGLSIELQANPFKFTLYHHQKKVLQSVTDGHIKGGLRLQPVLRGEGWSGLSLALGASEAVYGLGEKFGALNKRGQLITAWNEDALGVNSEFSYKNAPFAFSPNGWGLYVNTPSRTVHGVGYSPWSHRSYVVLAEEETLDLFFFVGTPAQILERYTWLTGRSPLLPRWSYGVWWSRCYYRTADELLEAARGLRERGIPAELIKLDGRAWLEVATRCTLDFDPSRYPDPAGFMQQVKAMNFKMCVWEYPLVSTKNALYPELAAKGYFLKDAKGEPYIFRWDPEPFGQLLTPLPDSGIIDFTNPDAYRWWQELHQQLWDLQIDVIKTDFGEQVPPDAVAFNGDSGLRLHNVYPMLYNQAVFEATPDRLVFGRSSYTGSQRYPVQWGGDPQADWEGLAGSIRGGLCWGLSGAAHQTHDIGGFYGPMPSPELYVRWTQAGVMTSHTRFHGTSPREPWYFGPEAEAVVKKWLHWRMRLIPYLEQLAQEAHNNGQPLARAMPLAFPDQPLSWGFEHQYMLGHALLVAPVIEPGGEATLYLPEGHWYDLWTGERLQGGRRLVRQMPLDQIPLYGREGTWIPLGPVAQFTGQIPAGQEVQQIWAFGESTLVPSGYPVVRWTGQQKADLFG